MEIALTRGKVAIIDDEDAPLVAGYKWHAFKGGSTWYATAKPPDSKEVRMHNIIMQPAPGMFVDHRDRDGLNNRRSNLRLANRHQNSQNRRARRTRSHFFKGISFDRDKGMWRWEIAAYGKRYQGPRCQTAEEAARAYDAKARELHGEFAVINFPEIVQP